MKTLITLPVTYFTAALTHMAKQDVRFYLNGVHVIGSRIEATDGHRLMVANYTKEVTVEDSDIDFIIPREAVELLLKQLSPSQKKNAAVSITQDGDNYQISPVDDGETTKAITGFKPLDGTFPNVDRIIPANSNLNVGDKLPVSFNWDYVADVQKAAVLFTGTKGVRVVMNCQDDTSSALFTVDGHDEIFFVVMPLRK